MICTAASCCDLTALYAADTAITVRPAPPHWAKKASICTATGFTALHCVMETWLYMNLNSLCFAAL